MSVTWKAKQEHAWLSSWYLHPTNPSMLLYFQAKVTLLEDQLRGAATSMISEREEQLNAQMRQLEVQLAAAVPQEEFAQLQAEMRAQNQQLQDTLARSGSEADVKAIQVRKRAMGHLMMRVD